MARSVNTKPHLDIQHVNRWQAQIGADLRKKTRKPGNRPDKGPAPGRKEEPLDPEDDFMIATDPADKPIDEATIDDAVAVAVDDWIETIQTEEPEMISTADLLDAIYDSDDPGEAFTEVFKRAEEEVKHLGLPRAINRHTIYEIGMRTGVDYEIDTHTKRAVFKDNFLNELVVDAYEVQLQLAEEDPAYAMDKNNLITMITEAYTNATSNDSEYEYLRIHFMNKFDIEEAYSDKGNPVGDYKIFEAAFKKVYKEGYKEHVGFKPVYQEGYFGYDSMEEMLESRLSTEVGERIMKRTANRAYYNAKRRAHRKYAKMYPEIESDDSRSPAQRFTLMDLTYKKEHGYSLWDDLFYDEFMDE